MPEFIKAFFANATERIKNPLIGTFLMSWILFNWKGILFLIISTNDIESKFTILSDRYYSFGIFILYPLLLALAYIFILPYINLLIDLLLRDINSKLQENIQRNKIKVIQDNTIVAIQNIKFEEAQAEYRDREKLNKEIKDLNQKLSIATINHDLEMESKNEQLLSLSTRNSELKDIILKNNILYLTKIDELKNKIFSNEDLFNNINLINKSILIDYINEMSHYSPNEIA